MPYSRSSRIVVANLHLASQAALPAIPPFGNRIPQSLLVVPIDQIKHYHRTKPHWVQEVAAAPLKYSALREWLLCLDAIKRNQTLTAIAPIPSPQNLKILLAEDNLINKQLALRFLAKFGYVQVDWVENGVKALAAVTQHTYDLVLMDVNMPELDGLAATRMIREQVPTTQQPIIVALTASALKADMLACEEAGMDDFLSKPFKKQEIHNMLEKWRKKIQSKQTPLEPYS